MKKLIDKWRTGAEQCLRGEMGYQVGGGFRGFSQKHTSEIFNLILINSYLFQAQIELSYMATPLFGGLLHALQEIWFIHLPIVDDDWSTPQRAAQRIDF